MTTNLNPQYFDRFTILFDRTMVSPPLDTTSAGAIATPGCTEEKCWLIDEFIKLKGLETVFNATSNPMGIGNITTGALIVYVWGGAATSAWGLAGTSRLRFYDT